MPQYHGQALQDNRWDDKGNFKVPGGDNFYDTLM